MSSGAKARSVICDYCGQPAVLLKDSASLYHGRDFGPVWHCAPCEAWVGCHKNSPTFAPLGRLANAFLRAHKQLAHAAFDPLWEAKLRRDGCSKSAARKAAYAWLAGKMGIPVGECHIGMFDAARCMEAVRICRSIREARP